MTDTVVIAEPAAQNVGYKFSWGLAIGGGVIATAVTFFLLTLGSGFGLLLANPMHTGAPTFFTGGAIYFFVAQAFGFAVGGHFAGRLLGPLIETQMQEDIRAGAHALVAWAVAVLAALAVVAFAGLTIANTGAKTATLYGSGAMAGNATEPAAYLVDKLYRPVGGGASGDVASRAEAARIVNADIAAGVMLTPDDHARLVSLVSRQAGIANGAAQQRVDAFQSDLRHTADNARKTASYMSLWIAFSLLFGAIVAMGAAVSARIEDDRQTPARAGF